MDNSRDWLSGLTECKIKGVRDMEDILVSALKAVEAPGGTISVSTLIGAVQGLARGLELDYLRQEKEVARRL